MNKFAYKSR